MAPDHLERGADPADGDEAELPHRCGVPRARNVDRAEPLERGPAGLPVAERQQRVHGSAGAVLLDGTRVRNDRALRGRQQLGIAGDRIGAKEDMVRLLGRSGRRCGGSGGRGSRCRRRGPEMRLATVRARARARGAPRAAGSVSRVAGTAWCREFRSRVRRAVRRESPGAARSRGAGLRRARPRAVRRARRRRSAFRASVRRSRRRTDSGAAENANRSGERTIRSPPPARRDSRAARP